MCVGTTTALGIAAAASAGAGIASAKIGSNAAQNAAATQSQAADKALGLQQQVYGDQKAAQAPYQQLGQQALGRLSAFQPSTAQFNPQNYQGGAPVGQQAPQPQMGTLASMGQQASANAFMPNAVANSPSAQQVPQGPGPNMVKLQAPDGTVRSFSREQADQLIAKGAKVVQ